MKHLPLRQYSIPASISNIAIDPRRWERPVRVESRPLELFLLFKSKLLIQWASFFCKPDTVILKNNTVDLQEQPPLCRYKKHTKLANAIESLDSVMKKLLVKYSLKKYGCRVYRIAFPLPPCKLMQFKIWE